jgi:hypothetical protein
MAERKKIGLELSIEQRVLLYVETNYLDIKTFLKFDSKTKWYEHFNDTDIKLDLENLSVSEIYNKMTDYSIKNRPKSGYSIILEVIPIFGIPE